MDRQGRMERPTAPVKGFNSGLSAVRLSPDGTRAALTVDADTVRAAPTPGGGVVTGSDIWIWEIGRGALTRLSFSGQAASPVWTPNGRRVCYRIGFDVWCQAADGSGQAEKLATVDGMTALKSSVCTVPLTKPSGSVTGSRRNPGQRAS